MGNATVQGPARVGIAAAVVCGVMMTVGAVISLAAAGRTPAPRDRHITIRARQYAYDPPVIRANRGDRLHIRLISADVVHGFYLEGHDIDAEVHPQQRRIKVRHPSKHDSWSEADEIVVVAKKPGKFRYRCSHTCGFLHPFMNGELVVAPNRLFHAGVGASAGLMIGFALIIWRKARNGASPSERGASGDGRGKT